MVEESEVMAETAKDLTRSKVIHILRFQKRRRFEEF